MLFSPKSRPFFLKGQESPRESVGTSDSASEDTLLGKHEFRDIRSRSRSRWVLWLIVTLAHVSLLCVYIGTVLCLRAEVNKLRKYGPRLVDTPANEGIEWELQTYLPNDMEHGPFSGHPRDEIDKNWHNLLDATNIIIEPEHMERWGRDKFGVATPDGKGFIGTLNVYHELHCIKRVWQYTYPEVYSKDATPEQRESERLHKEHCLDFLRKSAMCHADSGVITYQWAPNNLVPVANSTQHQCANWKKLDDWTKARTVNMMKPGYLVHPLLGLSYPEQKEDW
ncbi:hypothetical protein F4677DRAFT_443380 [Hypoxylon crocopeplum]|nr:hypothetical protein F4677DRAFT_443380 [Hypoxylon crocopeplum]